MIVNKILETTIDLFDSAEIYTADIESMLIKKLETRYKNKCFKSVLITEILKIIRYSDIKLVDNRLDGAAYINVQFEIKGIVLIKGEILTDCKVTEIITTGIIIEHKYAGGLIMPGQKTQIYNIIKKGQTIPVIISDVRYNIGQTEISIRGVPFTPQIFTNIYYNINYGLYEGEEDKLKQLLEDYNNELKLHNDIKNKSYEFFKELLYPYKNYNKTKATPIDANFNKLSTIKDCIISYLGEEEKNDTFIYKVEDNTKKHVINAPLYTVLSDIINRRIIYLQNLRELVTYYNTKEKIQEHMKYWQVCQMFKQ
jgi:DNA-directed RNA polymerase subunit E'/Rpb7